MFGAIVFPQERSHPVNGHLWECQGDTSFRSLVMKYFRFADLTHLVLRHLHVISSSRSMEDHMRDTPENLRREISMRKLKPRRVPITKAERARLRVADDERQRAKAEANAVALRKMKKMRKMML